MLQESETRLRAAVESAGEGDHVVGGVTTHLVESCHSIWVFDAEGMRFRRVPRGTPVGIPSPGDWARYYRFEFDPSTGAFAVALNPEGTRLLRSSIHVHPCPRCGVGEVTGELVLDPVGEPR